jgi:hypothetical protein
MRHILSEVFSRLLVSAGAEGAAFYSLALRKEVVWK